jgi:hypothetical protein
MLVAPAQTSAESTDQARIDPNAASALARQKGIPVKAARLRLVRERTLGVLGDRVEAVLAGRSGGSYLDARGKLVVTTLDTASKAVVARSGARAKLVDDSSARLHAIVKRLDRQASTGGAGRMRGWYVDVPNNSVVVTVTDGAADKRTAAMTKLAKSFGDSVRIEHRPAAEAPQPAESVAGGFEYVLPNGGTCSVGFNTVDAANQNVVLTAGHCTQQSGWISRGAYNIGQTRTSNFPTDDFGTFWNTYPDYWQASPSVDMYDGNYARLAGEWDNPPVGATVCKSGRTTGFTCGTITGLDETVTYGSDVVSGLVRHNACVEPGDSGGSNISANYYALGVTSGASLRANQCLSKFGEENVSWYQPIGEALSREGLRLVL